MNETLFSELINNHMSQMAHLDSIQVNGLDLYQSQLGEYCFSLFDKLLESYFTKEGVDWIQWWIYEYEDKEVIAAWDKNDNPIKLETVYDLYNLVKEYAI